MPLRYSNAVRSFGQSLFELHNNISKSLDNVVAIETGYGLDDREVGVRVPVFFLLHVVQTDSGFHPTSYPMGTEGFSRGKRPGREADHSPPANAKIKKMWIYISTPQYSFVV
jgi:hypothetical protein